MGRGRWLGVVALCCLALVGCAVVFFGVLGRPAGGGGRVMINPGGALVFRDGGDEVKVVAVEQVSVGSALLQPGSECYTATWPLLVVMVSVLSDGRPVTATIRLEPERQVSVGLAAFLYVPSGVTATVRVDAAGYEPWAVEVAPRLVCDRYLALPVQLSRQVDGQASERTRGPGEEWQTVLPPGGVVRVPVDAGAAPMVEAPRIQLRAEALDRDTKARVHSARFFVGGDEVWRGCCVTITLSSVRYTLTVEAPGYEVWSLGIRPSPGLRHHVVMTLPVWLEPVQPQASGKAQACLVVSEAPRYAQESGEWRGACNLPPVMWPDGCPEYAPVARPAARIPPPCVSSAAVYTDDEGLYLEVAVDHPEYAKYAANPREWVRVARYDGVWTVADVGGQTSCAKDEAPLAWALVEALNTRTWTPFEIYSGVLPVELRAALVDLGLPVCRVWLPVVGKGIGSRE